MGRRGISIIDIARIAGVSKTTVSNVLNDTGRVGEETRNLILEIAEREGYVANFAAKSLRASQTKTVGILVPDISNVFFSSIVLRLERQLYAAGYTSFVCDTESDSKREESYIRSMLHKQVDGLIFVNNSHPLDISSLPQGIPVIALDRMVVGTRDNLALVDNDVRQMSHDMTMTLLDRGSTHVALVIVSASHEPIERHPRYIGYVEALAEAGVRLDHRLILHGHHEQPSHIEAAQLVDELLCEGIPLDGIVAMGDRAAIGAMHALQAHGLGIGSEVRVIGCDDSPITELLSPSLSSVNRHVEELADHAVEQLLDYMQGSSPEYRTVIVPHEIVERATTLRA